MAAGSVCERIPAAPSRRYSRRGYRIEPAWTLAAFVLAAVVLGLWARDGASGDAPVALVSVTVKRGDTLWTLASRHGDPNQYILKRVDELRRINGLKSGGVLREGQVLVVPVGNAQSELLRGELYAGKPSEN